MEKLTLNRQLTTSINFLRVVVRSQSILKRSFECIYLFILMNKKFLWFNEVTITLVICTKTLSISKYKDGDDENFNVSVHWYPLQIRSMSTMSIYIICHYHIAGFPTFIDVLLSLQNHSMIWSKNRRVLKSIRISSQLGELTYPIIFLSSVLPFVQLLLVAWWNCLCGLGCFSFELPQS